MSHAFDAEQTTFLRLVGYLLLEHGHTKQARIIFEGILADRPEDIRVRLALGKTCLELEDFDPALAHAETFASSEAHDAHLGLFIKSHALWGMGLSDQSRDAMNQYISAIQKDKIGH